MLNLPGSSCVVGVTVFFSETLSSPEKVRGKIETNIKKNCHILNDKIPTLFV